MSKFRLGIFSLKKAARRLLFLSSTLLLCLLVALMVAGGTWIAPPAGGLQASIGFQAKDDATARLVRTWLADASTTKSQNMILTAKLFANAQTRADILLMVWSVKPCLLAGKVSVSSMPGQMLKWMQKGLRESMRTALIPSPASRCLRPGEETGPNLYRQNIAAETHPQEGTPGPGIIDINEEDSPILRSGAGTVRSVLMGKIDPRHAA
ncbi:hypothetical protein GJV11_06065 [Enterobacteriaceae bacterium RIT693]|jgi:hypothetical protein|nr:hypothetical protein [Enterobacteriaceae bacterium RIT693]